MCKRLRATVPLIVTLAAVVVLIEAGADVNAANGLGATPLSPGRSQPTRSLRLRSSRR